MNNSTKKQEVEKLRANLGQAKEKFITQWMQDDMMQYLAEQKRAQAELEQNGKRDIEQLKASLDSLKQQSQTNQRVLSERLVKMRERKEEVEHLLSDSDLLLREKESNSKQNLELKNTIVQEREALKTQDKSTKEKLEEFEKASVWFKDRLGLQFKKTPGNHQVEE